MKNMLREVLKELVELGDEVLGVIYDLLRKLRADKDGSLLVGMKKLLRNELGVSSKLTVDLDAAPYVPDGWTVESHSGGGQFVFDAKRVELYWDAEQKASSIVGDKLRRLLEEKNPYNANLLDFYLAHPELIPEGWKGKAVFFWGTVYRNSDGNLNVRCLLRLGGRWNWCCSYLNGDWGEGGPAVVPSK